ncbi:hypothetical protein BZA05DRAFT_135229 [Tricharina praecox]|uniref:uncharacterized protein n=1 Tax=Tricharina praecox TaxID=43433 RepID=UPI00221F746B|nr:uncharacterized protein BZA05DRAFT_135229 [Tricharina praecox]KAI5846748.1 hypothetical protein BZA05DRAFT_135229 [Tricharina praecox]
MRLHSLLLLAATAAAYAAVPPALPEDHVLRSFPRVFNGRNTDNKAFFDTNVHRHGKRDPQPVVQPTIADWWTLNTPQFLQSYLNSTTAGEITEILGRFGGLAHCYGLVNLRGHSKSTSDAEQCSNLRAELGTDDSARAEMVLASLTNFASTFELIADSIDGGFRGAGILIEELPYTKAWWDKFPKEGKAKLSQENVISIIRDSFISGMPWLTPEAWNSTAALVYDEASKMRDVSKVANVDLGAKSASLNKWDQLFGSQIDLKFLDEARRSMDYHPTMGRDSVEIMRVADGGVEVAEKIEKIVTSEEFAKAQEDTWNALFSMVQAIGRPTTLRSKVVKHLDTVSVLDFFGATASLAELSVGKSIAALFNGTLDMSGGLFELLEYGNLLSARNWTVEHLREVFPEMLARRLYHKILNYALAEDQVYITCTILDKDENKPLFGKYVEGSTCYHDRTGPQDMKACLDNEHVCYLYRWKEPTSKWKFWYRAHSDKPAGVEHWGAGPHLTKVSDIIKSSVSSKLQNLKDYRLTQDDKPLLTSKWTDITEVGKASTPGVFNVPVCYSNYSWNTPLEVAREKKHWYETPCRQGDPYCHEAALPCYCGSWGSETMDVWDAIGHVKKSKDGGTRARKVCGKRIKDRITHPIEAYVAYCRLDIKRVEGLTSNRVDGRFTTEGKDKYCDDVIRIIEVNGYESPASMDSEVRYAIYCKILGDGTRCRMYDDQWDALLAAVTPAVELEPDAVAIDEVVEEEVEKYESEFAKMVLEDDSGEEEEE